MQKGDGPNSKDKFVRQRVVGDKSVRRKTRLKRNFTAEDFGCQAKKFVIYSNREPLKFFNMTVVL